MIGEKSRLMGSRKAEGSASVGKRRWKSKWRWHKMLKGGWPNASPSILHSKRAREGKQPFPVVHHERQLSMSIRFRYGPFSGSSRFRPDGTGQCGPSSLPLVHSRNSLFHVALNS
jgi:hypothetical protein